MGPNLARLFEYKKLTGLKRELKDCATYMQRKQIFERHGEALIRMLEALEANPSEGMRFNARTLLARLEKEAQP